MWFLSLLLGSLCMNSFFADANSDIESCMAHVDTQKIQELVESPSPDELNVVCPMVLGYMDCLEDAVYNLMGVKLADIPAMAPGTEMAKAATLMINVKGVFKDLCTEGTDLHTAYKEHESCFGSIPNEFAETCVANAVAAYDTYKEFENNALEAAGENVHTSNRNCLVEAYKSACVAASIHEHCGQGAFDFYQQIVKRSTIFKAAICSEQELEELQTSFADSLELESDKKDLFRLAFDLKKRRK